MTTFLFLFLIFQSESIVRIIDARILDESPRAAYILMELGEMDFDKYLQSPASVAEPEGITSHCQSQADFHGAGDSM